MEALEYAIGGAIFLALLSIGWFVGRAVERNHLRSLARREHELSGILMSDIKRLPPNWSVSGAVLVHGEAVIATDYFKTFVGFLRNVFGGNVRAYESLLERARREAICRMLEHARSLGANAVWNVRLTTSSIGGQESPKPGGVEVIAYGTALRIASKAAK